MSILLYEKKIDEQSRVSGSWILLPYPNQYLCGSQNTALTKTGNNVGQDTSPSMDAREVLL